MLALGTKAPSLRWLYQRISAILLAIFFWLHYHLFVRRFISSGGISYSDLMERLSNPVFKLLEIAFIFFAISHGLNGLWSIIEENIHNNRYKQSLSILLWVIGVLLFLFISVLILLL